MPKYQFLNNTSIDHCDLCLKPISIGKNKKIMVCYESAVEIYDLVCFKEIKKDRSVKFYKYQKLNVMIDNLNLDYASF